MSDQHSLTDASMYARPDGQERRRYPRYLFSAAMTVRTSGGMPMPGISVEISAGGMSAMVSGLLKEGESVELEPVAGGRTLARVRHKLGRLYGLEFVDMSSEQIARITEDCQRFGRYRRTAETA
jgi:hypothetical protein